MITGKRWRLNSLLLAAVLAGLGIADSAGAQAPTKTDSNKSGSRSLTLPPPPVPWDPDASQLLPNGDFESGPTVWTEFSLLGYDIILDSDFPAGVFAHSGSWLAWLGGDFDEISWIEQQITLPSDALLLTYYHWIQSEDLCGYDFGKVSINGNIIDQYDLCEATNTLGWAAHQVDISVYAGQTVMVRIRGDTDDTWNSNLFIDDVALETTGIIFADDFESGDTSSWSTVSP